MEAIWMTSERLGYMHHYLIQTFNLSEVVPGLAQGIYF